MTRHVSHATLRLLPPLASLHQSSVMGCVDGRVYKTGDAPGGHYVGEDASHVVFITRS